MEADQAIHPEILYSRGRFPASRLTPRQRLIRAAIIGAVMILGAIVVLSLFGGYYVLAPHEGSPPWFTP
jgi:hypothetical protein